MSANQNLQSDRFSTLMQLEQAVRRCETLDALVIRITNETSRLIPCQHAVLFLPCGPKKVKAQAIANLSSTDRSAPMVHWMERLGGVLRKESFSAEKKEGRIRIISRNDVDEVFKKEWSAYFPEYIAWVELNSFKGTIGYLLISSPETWNDQHKVLLEHLGEMYGHALSVFKKPGGLRFFGLGISPARASLFWIFILFMAAYLIKVPLTTTAPAEIVPEHPHNIASTQNGVVKEIFVEPNQLIEAGSLVVQLDDTENRNRVEVSRMALNVSREKLGRARRNAFSSAESKALVAELQAQVERAKTELQMAVDLLEKSKLRSLISGIVIGAAKDEWEGKPISTGTTIFQVADPGQVQVRIFLPVKDAITLQQGSSIRVFLHTDPLHPLEARLKWAEYRPKISPMGFFAYRIQAEFKDTETPPRIGLRGSATLMGQKVSLLYVIFRKPFTFLRQTTGL